MAEDDGRNAVTALVDHKSGIKYVQYRIEDQEVLLEPIKQLIAADLSEPYSIYVYHYFLLQWPDLCFIALDEETEALRGVVICKLEDHRSGTYRGYIAMLATVTEFRGKGIATKLVKLAIDALKIKNADEIILETEGTNEASLRLYEKLGFIRTKKLHRYYLNGNSAYRLALYLKDGTGHKVPGPSTDVYPPHSIGDGFPV